MTARTTAAVALWLAVAATAYGAEPRVGTEHVVLHTTVGDLVLAFYPDVAPRTVAQILRLVRLGVYDTTYFYRIEPGFVAQLATAQSRREPLSGEQLDAIRPIPAEFSDIRHVRGTLSMAHEDGRPDSGETSFSILYGAAPHLDGKYTVFGRLEAGEDVLDAMAKLPRDAQNRPQTTIEVVRAEVADSPDALTRMYRPGATVPSTQSAVQGTVPAGSGSPMMAVVHAGSDGRPATPFLALVGVMMACGLGSFVLAGRAPVRLVGSLGLLTTLVGGFLVFTALAPTSASQPWIGLALFVGSIAVFKLMGRFESDRPDKRAGSGRAETARSPRSAA